MSDSKNPDAATGTLTVRYCNGSQDQFCAVPRSCIVDLCRRCGEANDADIPFRHPLAAVTTPDGNVIVINLTEVASISFISNNESDEERWPRQNGEARQEFSKVATHLPRARRAAS